MSELFTKACKYTPPGGEISVYVRPHVPGERTLQFSVSNPGTTIPAAALPHLFEKFYRLPGGDPWQQGGTGLGLSLIQGQVECLGGTITVTSEAQATVFAVSLPLLPLSMPVV